MNSVARRIERVQGFNVPPRAGQVRSCRYLRLVALPIWFRNALQSMGMGSPAPPPTASSSSTPADAKAKEKTEVLVYRLFPVHH